MPDPTNVYDDVHNSHTLIGQPAVRVPTPTPVVMDVPKRRHPKAISDTVSEIMDVAGLGKRRYRRAGLIATGSLLLLTGVAVAAGSGNNEPTAGPALVTAPIVASPAPVVVPPAEPEPTTATVMVWSDPPGATVTSPDGLVQGLTPLVVEGAPGSDTTLYLSQVGRRPAVSYVRFPTAGDTDALTVPMAPIPTLVVTSSPAGATVVIPELGLSLGKTPLTWQPDEATLAKAEAGALLTLELKRGRTLKTRKLTSNDLHTDATINVRLARKKRPKRRAQKMPPAPSICTVP
ncbi:MAG: hypothetical protein ACI9WU_002574 [Myxococcota bacterium]|jgi:hypothetical protein